MTWISGSFVVLELPLELKAAAPQRFLVDSQAPWRVSKAIHENTKVRPDAVDATTRPIPPTHLQSLMQALVEWCHSTDACDRRGFPNRPGNIWQIYRECLAIGEALEDPHLYRPTTTTKRRKTPSLYY